MMCKFKVWMDKGGHYDGKSKGGCNRGQYDVQIKRADGWEGISANEGGGIMMCKLKGGWIMWKSKIGQKRVL